MTTRHTDTAKVYDHAHRNVAFHHLDLSRPWGQQREADIEAALNYWMIHCKSWVEECVERFGEAGFKMRQLGELRRALHWLRRTATKRIARGLPPYKREPPMRDT